VLAWFDQHGGDELWLSVLAVAELSRGAQLLRRRDPDAADQLDEWLTNLVARFSDRILPIDLRATQRWALLGIPDPLPVVDGLLAATALDRDLVLVTRNVADVARSGVAHVNPFE
jgi:hypothetical protein